MNHGQPRSTSRTARSRLMAEVIDRGYKHLEESDLKAIAVYVKSLEPIENDVKAK